jgi:seryl-tRNA synthetase
MVEARDEITQLVENSDLNLETQAGEQNKLMIQSVGLDETIRSQISDSDGQPESPEVAAQIASNSNAKEDAFEPSTGRPHNELSSRALEKKNASEPSTTTMEALSSGSKDSERTTESGQTTTSADHSNTIKKWRKGGSFSNERARKLRDDKEELKDEVRELKDEVQALKQEREEREARFQEAQEDALKLLERDAINALPDNVVRNEFKQIFAGSRQWTKKWAVSDTNVVAFNDIKRMIRIMLTGHLDKKSVSTKGMQAAYSGTLNQRRILTTLVTRHLACSLFQRPFFYLRNLNRSSASHHKSIENALQQVQDLGIASLLYLLRVEKS